LTKRTFRRSSDMKNPDRTTLLINLSVGQAEQIRAQAKKQGRTISSYVLRAVMSRLEAELKVENRDQNFFETFRRPR
jgi:uncharacterized protein (DUF1778 family)